MTTIRKIILAVAIGCIAVGAWGQFGPALDWSLPSIEWLWPSKGPITQAVAIAESGKPTPEWSNIVNGETARALRKAGKWKLYDPNDLPLSAKPLIDQAKPTSIPWLIIDHGGKATWSGPCPMPEEAFAERIKQQGGF